VALLRVLAERSKELGIVLHVAHLHHGLRGEEADADLRFVFALAERLGLQFHSSHVDTSAEAAARPGKPTETVEEAARRLRYGWFRGLMSEGIVDAVATAHTLDDQAETVLAKFLRGAWTEGLSGIHPVVQHPEGTILRPLLGVQRAEIEQYLRDLGQEWREDSSNRHLSFTRNRIRHELLPLLEGWNPTLRAHLAQMADLAREEESWWSAEVECVAREVLLTGRPVRGGGRAAADIVSLDVGRLGDLAPALQRRLVRLAAKRLGAALDFAGTEALRTLAVNGRAGQKCELAGGLAGERTHRELRLAIQAAGTRAAGTAKADSGPAVVEIPVPGQGFAADFGLRVKIDLTAAQGGPAIQSATLRTWRAGDRVRLRHSSASRKVKEVLERMKVSGAERALWPVLEWEGRIVWMQGVVLEPEPRIEVTVSESPAEPAPAG